MPRDVDPNEIHNVHISDMSGETHEFYVRNPGPQERAKYQAALIQRKGGDIRIRTTEARLKYGLPLIVGFKKGTLADKGKLFSSDQEDEDYAPDWKQKIRRGASDLIDAVARKMYESTDVETGGFEEEDYSVYDEDPSDDKPVPTKKEASVTRMEAKPTLG